MSIDLIFITYNRLDYTKLALPALLADPTEEFSLVIWDNASTDDTKDYLSSVVDPRIVKKFFSEENVGLRGAINYLFSKSSADLVGIVPNDLLVNPGWTRPIAQAHADVPEFGLIGCWHLGEKFFDEERARHKIHRFGHHQILRHPWTGGAAGLAKMKAVRECGLLESNATPPYWMHIAQKGYVNGYYFPLIHAEHMDYPWSKYYAFHDRIKEGIIGGHTYKKRRIKTIEEAKAWHRVVVDNILDDPWDVKYYIGWRQILRKIKSKTERFFIRL